ncbi:carotenoid oxygenase family protein [Paraburkholderia sp. J67]|uniref:carotenoid oxygenase family protein n=1 Tax=Paraburkholderia sp. J67 TaxID=2805435 RepID=UPI002ABE78AF|nr:carotenoid oxygenase family protein [Paraburkholderia sp. J67]
MAATFPAPMKFGFDEPLRFEGEISDLEILEGAVPADLDGLYVQAVPDYQYAPISDILYPMDLGAGGDGMVRAFRFEQGRAAFSTKYICTERFNAQREAGRGLFGQYRNPYSDAPEAKGIERTTANTMINFHAGVLLAAKEDGVSYAIDPATLRTIGPWRANGAIQSQTMTAHPKFDPATGEMFTFGYFADGVGSMSIRYYVVDALGKVTHEASFDAPEPWMIHDCAVTPNYFLLPLMQYSTDVARIKDGGPFWMFEPDEEMIVGVIPRYGSADEVRWLRGPKCVLTHTANAFEEDGLIKFDVLRVDGNAFGFVVPDKDGRGGPFGSAPTSLVRWTIDPCSGSDRIETCEVLAKVTGEGPHVDERWHAKKHRYLWLPELKQTTAAADMAPPPLPPMPPIPGAFPGAIPARGPLPAAPQGNEHGSSPTMFNAISLFDLEAGTKRQWYAGDDTWVQDPVFCPRSADALEGDGYIMVIRNRRGVRGGELVILDAQQLEAGPLAVLNVPVSLRLGIHASWVTGYRLK